MAAVAGTGANEHRYGLRRVLLDRVVALQLEVQTSGDPEARALLEQARSKCGARQRLDLAQIIAAIYAEEPAAAEGSPLH